MLKYSWLFIIYLVIPNSSDRALAENTSSSIYLSSIIAQKSPDVDTEKGGAGVVTNNEESENNLSINEDRPILAPSIDLSSPNLFENESKRSFGGGDGSGILRKIENVPQNEDSTQ